jgi:hypothetical protein
MYITSAVPLNINAPRTTATFHLLIQEILRTFLAVRKFDDVSAL